LTAQQPKTISTTEVTEEHGEKPKSTAKDAEVAKERRGKYLLSELGDYVRRKKFLRGQFGREEVSPRGKEHIAEAPEEKEPV